MFLTFKISKYDLKGLKYYFYIILGKTIQIIIVTLIIFVYYKTVF